MTTTTPEQTTQGTTDLEFLEALFPYEETGDPNVKTHIVNPPRNLHIWREGMSAQDIVDIARATSQEVVALCGYRWVPRHNPEKFQACDKCLKIAGLLISDREG